MMQMVELFGCLARVPPEPTMPRDGLSEVHDAYQAGELHPTHIDWVLDTRDQLAMMLADLEDVRGCGDPMAISAMRAYEEMASNMLHAWEASAKIIEAA